MTMAFTVTYERAFFESIGEGSRNSARRIVPLVLSMLNVRSVVDVGCGEGSWLAEFQQNGVHDAFGLDGGYVPTAVLKIPDSSLHRCDLSRPFRLDREFDLAVSLETAEHLPRSRAAGFVADLTRLSTHVLFSAAIPFQRGTHHVNCQWADYWQGLFEGHEYIAFDVVRPAVWDDELVEFWYRQNTILYVRRNAAEANPALRPLVLQAQKRVKRLVHPELCDRWDGYSLREVLALLPSIVKQAIDRRTSHGRTFLGRRARAGRPESAR
jgi:SAM-dependent methyltransferase